MPPCDEFMNQEQALVVLRASLTIIGSLLLGHGVVNDSQWTTISGALLTVAPVLWGLWVNRKTGIVKKAAQLPDVTKVEVKPTEAGKELAKSSTPEAQIVVGK